MTLAAERTCFSAMSVRAQRQHNGHTPFQQGGQQWLRRGKKSQPQPLSTELNIKIHPTLTNREIITERSHRCGLGILIAMFLGHLFWFGSLVDRWVGIWQLGQSPSLNAADLNVDVHPRWISSQFSESKNAKHPLTLGRANPLYPGSTQVACPGWRFSKSTRKDRKTERKQKSRWWASMNCQYGDHAIRAWAVDAEVARSTQQPLRHNKVWKLFPRFQQVPGVWACSGDIWCIVKECISTLNILTGQGLSLWQWEGRTDMCPQCDQHEIGDEFECHYFEFDYELL